MASVPLKHTPDAPLPETVEERFRRLEAAWNAETAYLSDPMAIIEHPAFQEIIRMGQAVVPLMLRDLAERPRLWVWALPQITGANPVPPADGGKIAKMTEAWLHWAEDHGYRW
jgi:hypothetical protein